MLTACGLIVDHGQHTEFPSFGSSWALVLELIFESADDDIAMIV